jgi:hypothetical protein
MLMPSSSIEIRTKHPEMTIDFVVFDFWAVVLVVQAREISLCYEIGGSI